jgi:hypothetical protein
MAYNDPSDPRRPDDYIERSGNMGWTPIVLVIAFTVVLGFLVFGAPKSVDQPGSTTQRGELPSTAPRAPPVPTPSPPKPQ